MLATYFDESADKNNRILVVCGLFARGTAINSLEKKWVRRLEKVNEKLIAQGRKPLSRYHASEMNALDNEFEGWTAEESKAFSKQLLRIIRQGDLYAIAHAVVIADFVKVYPEVAADPKGWAYQHAMWECLRRIGFHFGQHIPKHERATRGISVVFDRSREFKPRALHAYDLIKDDPRIEYRECFNSMTEGNNLTHIALQPADLLAYEIMRELNRKLLSSSTEMRKFFKKMVRGRKVQVEATYSNKRYFLDLKESARKNREKAELGEEIS
jgi:hypothetical protein